MAARTDRMIEDAKLIALAFHDPDGLGKLQRTEQSSRARRLRSVGPKWWQKGGSHGA
jgi:hypothetical protein